MYETPVSLNLMVGRLILCLDVDIFICEKILTMLCNIVTTCIFWFVSWVF